MAYGMNNSLSGTGLSGFNPNQMNAMTSMNRPVLMGGMNPSMNSPINPPMNPQSPTFQSPANINPNNPSMNRPSFMDRFKQGMPGMLSNMGQMMGNYGNRPNMNQGPTPLSQGQGSMFQRAFARNQPNMMNQGMNQGMNQPMPNRRTDMSQFML